MENDYTLTVRLRPPLHDKLDRYAKRMGMTRAGAVRCLILGLPEEDDGPGMEQEYTRAIDKWTKKRDALRQQQLGQAPTGQQGRGEREEGEAT